MSLRKKARSSFAWALAERITGVTATLAIQICLARLLPPEDFGVVATVTILLSISRVLVDGGFGQALIQKKSIERDDVSSVFIFNILLAIVVCLGLIFAAPRVASFFNEPKLESVLPVLSLGLVFTAFGQTQMTILSRHLEFPKLFRISLPALVVGGSVGIGMALSGWHVWSLVGQNLASSFTQSAVAWRYGNPLWRPQLAFSITSLRSMLRFGSGMLGSTLMWTFFDNLYGLIIGKAFSMGDLAFYNRARSFQRMPVQAITTTLNSVLFPVLSTVQDRDDKIREALRTGLPVLAFFTFPAMIGMMVMAEPFVITLLTEKWRPSVPYMRLFPIIGMLYPLSAINLTILRAKGKSQVFFATSVFKTSISVVLLVVSMRFGVMAILMGQVAAAIIGYVVNIYLSQIFVRYSVWNQFVDTFTCLIPAAVAACSCTPLTLLIDNAVLLLGAQSVAFVLVYLLVSHGMDLPAYHRVRSEVQRALRIRAMEQGPTTR